MTLNSKHTIQILKTKNQWNRNMKSQNTQKDENLVLQKEEIENLK